MIAYRGLQLVVWVLESREHAGFRDQWAGWARRDLAWLAVRLDLAERGAAVRATT